MIHNSAGANPLNQIANIKKNNIIFLGTRADTNQLPTMNVRIKLTQAFCLLALARPAIISRRARPRLRSRHCGGRCGAAGCISVRAAGVGGSDSLMQSSSKSIALPSSDDARLNIRLSARLRLLRSATHTAEPEITAQSASDSPPPWFCSRLLHE